MKSKVIIITEDPVELAARGEERLDFIVNGINQEDGEAVCIAANVTSA
ncbi:hypothetical protein [Cytobacillus sp.]|nr:hypothetical protein [Cytobacillus sp.]